MVKGRKPLSDEQKRLRTLADQPGKGEWAGQRFRLEPWQQFIIWNIFGWKNADDTRRFRYAYIEIARKNGKTALSAGIGLYMLFADGEAWMCYSSTRGIASSCCPSIIIFFPTDSVPSLRRISGFWDIMLSCVIAL
ncbi:MAG: terminase large subunit domain-containing protein [Candidatus Cryptobacteroides sp.]